MYSIKTARYNVILCKVKRYNLAVVINGTGRMLFKSQKIRLCLNFSDDVSIFVIEKQHERITSTVPWQS